MEIAAQFIPMAMLIAIIYFLIVRPIRRRISNNNVSLFDAIPTWAYFVSSVILVCYSVLGDLYVQENSGRAFFDRNTARELGLIQSITPVLIAVSIILFAAGIYRATRK